MVPMMITRIIFRLLFLLIGIIPDGRRESHHGEAEDVEERERGERDVRLRSKKDYTENN